MLNVTSISQARIPVIKFEHPPDNQPIDIALANQVAIRNTALFHAYTKADPRVRPLIMVIKYWASRRVISEAALNGNIINSYTHVLMMIAYLQRMRVVPPLQRICCGKFLTKIMAPRMTNPNPQNISNRVCLACGKLMPDVVMVDGYNTYFYEKTLAEKSPNPMSAAKLLVEFFRYYAFEFNYETECVSVRQGTTIDREAKGWRDYGPGDGDKSHALCVEDPFVLERNTAVSARRWTIAGIRWEYERAARGLLSGRGLEAVCTPWQEWPITQYDDMNIYGDQ
ncbi:hypothetical protein BDF19DRAFT_284452 [Syncephalis fuscata]|nr:hypothetical protein BDF19DRAFT_284452 [Syncephalis fuscata]